MYINISFLYQVDRCLDDILTTLYLQYLKEYSLNYRLFRKLCKTNAHDPTSFNQDIDPHAYCTIYLNVPKTVSLNRYQYINCTFGLDIRI